jgi:hypothetical protein
VAISCGEKGVGDVAVMGIMHQEYRGLLYRFSYTIFTVLAIQFIFFWICCVELLVSSGAG